MIDQTPNADRPEAVRIPARNKRQAMDWSLVLASQGIEHAIKDGGGNDWALAVAEKDFAAANDAIRLYREENLGWPWRRAVFKSAVLFDWGALVWVLMIVVMHAASMVWGGFRTFGIMDGASVGRGEWWRL